MGLFTKHKWTTPFFFSKKSYFKKKYVFVRPERYGILRDMDQPIAWNKNRESFDDFKARFPAAHVVDYYGDMLEELFCIQNPQYRFEKSGYEAARKRFSDEHLRGEAMERAGKWFYFPWSALLIHYLDDEPHQELRTARNRNLITKEEQQKFYDFKIGIAGLSVGSHAALTLAMMGAGRVMKLSDRDTVSLSNLNRLRYDASALGRNKCDLVAEQIWQMNPYAEVFVYNAGISEENLHEFLAGPPKLDLLVEEMDNLEMKIRLRLEAKKIGIPVVMATDNGDNIIVDIERFDLDPNLRIFNGALGDNPLEEFSKMTPLDLVRLSTKIAGPELVATKMHRSLLEVGKTLYSWPQLGDAATLSGVAAAYAARRIALGEPLKTGKIEINLDAIFDPNYYDPRNAAARDEERRAFLKTIGLET